MLLVVIYFIIINYLFQSPYKNIIDTRYTQTDPDSRDDTIQALTSDLDRVNFSLPPLIQYVNNMEERVSALTHDYKTLRDRLDSVT